MGTKLIMSVVQDDDADQLTKALREGGFSCTKISTTGGFLRKGNATFMIGVEEEKIGAVLNIIKKSCRTRTHLLNPYLFAEPEAYMPEMIEVQVGGAVIFVLEVERVETV